MSWVRYTNGPDARNGLGSCGKCKQIHDGARTGYPDRCCCCDPCRYFKTTAYDSTASPSDRLKNRHCCRCLPFAICAIFTPYQGENPCCGQIGAILYPETNASNDGHAYSGVLAGIDLSVTQLNLNPAQSAEELGTPEEIAVSCIWRVESVELGIIGNGGDVVIDHTNITCLQVSGISIEDVTLTESPTSCTGMITFSAYSAEKVKFVNRWHDGTAAFDPYDGDGPDIDINLGVSPCACIRAARMLCVWGRRTSGGDIERVEFEWEGEDTDPRWKYVPPCGNPSLQTEYIRLRGAGTAADPCYLEFDFQASGDTNDWAIPPNSVGSDPNEIRDGMVLIGDNCGCGMFFDSTPNGITVAEAISAGTRFVRVHAGYCSRWRTLCGRCRCVPQKLCVIGEIDGDVVQAVVTWNGVDGWSGDYAATGGNKTITLTLEPGPECSEGSATYEDGCYITVNNGDFTTPLKPSLEVECGRYMTFELESDVNDLPEYNWLWAQSSLCGCVNQSCGPCVIERCGGTPQVIYADLVATGTPRMDNCLGEFGDPTTCSLTVPMLFYQRWALPITDPPVLLCGWIGYGVVTCDNGSFPVRVEWTPQEGAFQVWRLDSGVWNEWAIGEVPIEQDSCDPFAYSYTSEDFALNEVCFWGCVCVTQYSITVTE